MRAHTGTIFILLLTKTSKDFGRDELLKVIFKTSVSLGEKIDTTDEDSSSTCHSEITVDTHKGPVPYGFHPVTVCDPRSDNVRPRVRFSCGSRTVTVGLSTTKTLRDLIMSHGVCVDTASQ